MSALEENAGMSKANTKPKAPIAAKTKPKESEPVTLTVTVSGKTAAAFQVLADKYQRTLRQDIEDAIEAHFALLGDSMRLATLEQMYDYGQDMNAFFAKEQKSSAKNRKKAKGRLPVDIFPDPNADLFDGVVDAYDRHLERDHDRDLEAEARESIAREQEDMAARLEERDRERASDLDDMRDEARSLQDSGDYDDDRGAEDRASDWDADPYELPDADPPDRDFSY